MNRTDRLMGILLELQARGELRAEDLAETFEVSVRTIYRDVEALCETGVPVVATPGKGYRLMEGYFLPPLTLHRRRGGPAGTRRRACPRPGRSAAATGPPRRRCASSPASCRPSVATTSSGGVRASVSPRCPPPPDQAGRPPLVLARRAIEERRVARLLYHAFRRDAARAARRRADPAGPPERRLVPGRLLPPAPGRRLFRLDRIDRLEVLDERFTPARGTPSPSGHERDVEATPRRASASTRRCCAGSASASPSSLLREEQDDARRRLRLRLARRAGAADLAPALGRISRGSGTGSAARPPRPGGQSSAGSPHRAPARPHPRHMNRPLFPPLPRLLTGGCQERSRTLRMQVDALDRAPASGVIS